MGYMRHHAIVVTSCLDQKLDLAYKWAVDHGIVVTTIVRSPVNGYRSFLVVPDGSKEGWEASDEGDRRRSEFLAYCDSLAYEEDSSSPLEWAEVQYGDGEGQTRIVRHSDEAMRREAPR